LNDIAFNPIEWGDKRLGVICSGAAYTYTKEALPNASVLKLGMVYPLPKKLITEFASKVDELIVIEDMEPFFEDTIKSWGINCSGKDKTGLQGELFARKVAKLFGGRPDLGPQETPGLPMRPPVLCPGCPHRALFYTLKKLNLTVSADIGCYTLGALPPLSSVDSVVCMGASIGIAHGMEKARGSETAKHTVGVIGDSTFIHSGITPLIDVVYNKGNATIIIVDNSTTGMTGHQQNPATGKNIRDEAAPQLDLVKLCQTIGVKRVKVVDPFELDTLEKMIKEEVEAQEPSVIISRRPCALLIKEKHPALKVDGCKNCGMCLKLGCPAIIKLEDRVMIDASQCNGCGLCAKVCKFGALKGE
jgi:indolepyruvate ferredoxin oxidoreductase alpha subunit